MSCKYTDAAKVACFAEKVIDLTNASLSKEFYYRHLSLCVIDAVFSINARYKAVQNVIDRYCGYFCLEEFKEIDRKHLSREEQEPLHILKDRFDQLGVEKFSNEIFMNRQRTSTRSGILKSEAVYKFATILSKRGVNYFQDIPNAMNERSLVNEVLNIPGQKSGISLTYFWMLAGSENLIKPDRHIARFIQQALERKINPEKAAKLLFDASCILSERYPNITPRLLDYQSWHYATNLK